MAKKMLIDATHAEETRVVVVDGNKVEEFDFESENKRQLAGNIYLAKVTRVEPSLQAAFIDYGGNRHGFLAFAEIHPDYYQIPVADREALMAEERAYAEAQRARDEAEEARPAGQGRRGRRSGSSRAARSEGDAVTSTAIEGDAGVEEMTSIAGMETIEFDADLPDEDEGLSPMARVPETPVEEPEETAGSDADDGRDADADADVDDRAGAEASAEDDGIESVSDDDDVEEIRAPRKPRPRKYKIQEVIKVRQIMLVQVVKEERGNKGAALTTYLSLAGRYCVLMPNTERGGGISRKITNAADRKKLKEIAQEIEVPRGAGLIVRTAGARRTKPEIKRDYEYLLRLWEQIRELTLKSIAPAKIYEEGDLIKRSIRDLYSRDIDEVLVEGERGYRIAKDFMKMIMPSHAVNVKQYRESLPLFARFQVESYLSSMFNPTVQLKSGGYIVIGVTEALVAIDVNSGRATKEGSIEETALKTNLEAADEVARQLRLRDLAGLIVIDFIDMDERRNNAAVEKRMKERLKSDRARIQIGRISGFGLMEMSRQRLRPGMIEATTQPCPHCHGTGLIRSDDNLALSILRQIEEEGTRRRSKEVLLSCPVGIANYLMNQKREHIAQIEARYGLSVRIEGNPALIAPDFTLEKFKTATRVVVEAPQAFISSDSGLMQSIDEDAEAGEADPAELPADDEATEAPRAEGRSAASPEDGEGEDGRPKKRRRRRRRRGGAGNGSRSEGEGSDGQADDLQADQDVQADAAQGDDAAASDAVIAADADADADAGATDAGDKPARKTVRRSSSSRKAKAEPAEATAPEPAASADEAEPPAKPATRSRRKPAAKKPVATEATEAPVAAPVAEDAGAAGSDDPAPEPAKPARKPRAPRKPKAAAAETPAAEPEAQDSAPADAVAQAPAPEPAAAPVAMAAAANGAVSTASGTVSPAAEAATETEAATEADDTAAPGDDGKPKRKGWWSLGR